ncbi:MAG: response regulator, partial [Bdellovibrionales bacterium]|nr:response regulator [Bdellovibrionales bacterium]
DLSGIEVCRQIKTHNRYVSYIIFITGKTEDADLIEALESGGDDYLSKPFKREILQSKIRAGIRILTREHDLSLMVSQRESLIEAIPDALVSLSHDGRLKHWNAVAEQLFNLKAHHQGMTFQDAHSRWDWRRVGDAIAQCLTGGKRSALPEIPCDIHGYPGYVEVNIAPVGQGTNSKYGALVIAKDISIRKQLESDLGQARRLELIGQLASGVAHEINTPTQFVGDNLEFLQDSFGELIEAYRISRDACQQARCSEQESSELESQGGMEDSEFEYLSKEVPKAINRSIEGIKHVSEIVRAMNQFAHPGAKEKEEACLNELLQNTVIVSKNGWKNIARVDFNLDENLPRTKVVASEINQVILNIIMNASHAIETRLAGQPDLEGVISIKTWADEWHIHFAIADNGSGMTKATKERIFDPFFTTKEVGKGTGQGLSISHVIVVDNHGGYIVVESKVGEGTRFTISLPRTACAGNQMDSRGELL